MLAFVCINVWNTLVSSVVLKYTACNSNQSLHHDFSYRVLLHNSKFLSFNPCSKETNAF